MDSTISTHSSLIKSKKSVSFGEDSNIVYIVDNWKNYNKIDILSELLAEEENDEEFWKEVEKVESCKACTIF